MHCEAGNCNRILDCGKYRPSDIRCELLRAEFCHCRHLLREQHFPVLSDGLHIRRFQTRRKLSEDVLLLHGLRFFHVLIFMQLIPQRL